MGTPPQILTTYFKLISLMKIINIHKLSYTQKFKTYNYEVING
jgi:hypothetical protein